MGNYHFQGPSPTLERGKGECVCVGGVQQSKRGKKITIIIWKLGNEKATGEVKKRPLLPLCSALPKAQEPLEGGSVVQWGRKRERDT